MNERFLPLTWTAEMTLSHLADAGDADARALFDALGLDNEAIIDSPATILSPEYRLARTVFLATRREATDALAALTKASLFVDLPCGFSPRALRYAREGKRCLGLDLPPVVKRIEAAVLPLADADARARIRYASADATDPEALLSAAGDGSGELCILTEGLLMYFSEEETRRFLEGVRRLLALRGGCLITADPEMPLHLFLTLRAICGDRLSEVTRAGFRRKPIRSGRQLPAQPRVPSPLQIEVRSDLREQIGRALAFLSQFGLKADRLPLSVFLHEPILPGKLSPAQSAAVYQAMDAVSCWVISPV